MTYVVRLSGTTVTASPINVTVADSILNATQLTTLLAVVPYVPTLCGLAFQIGVRSVLNACFSVRQMIVSLQPLRLTSQPLVPPTGSSGAGGKLNLGYLVAIGVGTVSLLAFVSLFVSSRYRRHKKLKSLLRSPARSPPPVQPAEDKATDIATSLMVYSPLHRLNKGAAVRDSEAGPKKIARVSRSSKERTAMAPMQPKSSRHLLGPSVRTGSAQIELKAVNRDASFVNPLLLLSGGQGPVKRREPTGV